VLRVTIAPGATLDYTIVSSGTGCVVSGAGYGWQRQADDGTWQMLTPGLPFPAYAVFLAPGATQAKHAQFPADAGPAIGSSTA
jgi:hypothetical protein